MLFATQPACQPHHRAKARPAGRLRHRVCRRVPRASARTVPPMFALRLTRIDEQLGRVLVCLLCQAVMPALTVQRALDADDDDNRQPSEPR
jgi:hypothetical protein